jgi:hypothetical protein
MLEALTVWSTVLIVVLGVVVDALTSDSTRGCGRE